MPQFDVMTCFKISHHKSTVYLWSSNPKFKYMQHGAHKMRKKDQKCAYLVIASHPIYNHLQQKYGLSVKNRKRVEDDSDNNDDSEDE